MRDYKTPNMEVITFNADDVIVTSGGIASMDENYDDAGNPTGGSIHQQT